MTNRTAAVILITSLVLLPPFVRWFKPAPPKLNTYVGRIVPVGEGGNPFPAYYLFVLTKDGKACEEAFPFGGQVPLDIKSYGQGHMDKLAAEVTPTRRHVVEITGELIPSNPQPKIRVHTAKGILPSVPDPRVGKRGGSMFLECPSIGGGGKGTV
jgi:hypothetical protein